jgi:hypothetical protein
MRRSPSCFKLSPLARIYASALALGVLALGNSVRAQAADYVWIEGEAPTSINVTPSNVGVARPQFLSGNKWLHITLDSGAVEKEAPEDGVLLTYKFNLPTAGNHESGTVSVTKVRGRLPVASRRWRSGPMSLTTCSQPTSLNFRSGQMSSG